MGHGPHSSKIFVLFCVLLVLCCSLYCLCVNVLLPPGYNPIAVNKYIISRIANCKCKYTTKYQKLALCPVGAQLRYTNDSKNLHNNKSVIIKFFRYSMYGLQLCTFCLYSIYGRQTQYFYRYCSLDLCN